MSSGRCGLGIAVALVSAWMAAPRAAAQFGPDPGDLGVFFDAAGTEATTYVSALMLFDIYVLSFDVPGGMLEYELAVQVPPGLIIAGGRQLPAGALDSGVGDDNWIVSTGGACLGASGAFSVVTYAQALFLSPPPPWTPICLSGSTPSRFGNLPGYVGCSPAGELHPFGPAYVGCAVINPEITPAQSTSFGALKGRWKDRD